MNFLAHALAGFSRTKVCENAGSGLRAAAARAAGSAPAPRPLAAGRGGRLLPRGPAAAPAAPRRRRARRGQLPPGARPRPLPAPRQARPPGLAGGPGILAVCGATVLYPFFGLGMVPLLLLNIQADRQTDDLKLIF